MFHSLFKSPVKIFLLDAAGAFLTALMTGFVVSLWPDFTGIPLAALQLLSLIALVFCVYDLLSFAFGGGNRRLLLQIIMGANLLYCCITIAIMIIHHQTLTQGGFLYFTGESILICALVFLEWKVKKQLEAPENRS